MRRVLDLLQHSGPALQRLGVEPGGAGAGVIVPDLALLLRGRRGSRGVGGGGCAAGRGRGRKPGNRNAGAPPSAYARSEEKATTPAVERAAAAAFAAAAAMAALGGGVCGRVGFKA